MTEDWKETREKPEHLASTDEVSSCSGVGLLDGRGNSLEIMSCPTPTEARGQGAPKMPCKGAN